jgi:hypothetical protein
VWLSWSLLLFKTSVLGLRTPSSHGFFPIVLTAPFLLACFSLPASLILASICYRLCHLFSCLLIPLWPH